MKITDKINSLIPMHEIEQGAQKQIYDNAEIPFVLSLAIMPDCHQGYDLPIGSVALVEDHICPSYVGYDIGCGMTFMDAGFSDDYCMLRKEMIYHEITKAIPVGFNENTDGTLYAHTFLSASGDKELTKTVNEKLDRQYGTLGSGNHFIEIGTSQQGSICITIHSGSRRPGWLIGNWYMNKAKQNLREPYKKFFKLDSELGRAYLNDMNFALQYALANRKRMLQKVCDILEVQMNVHINENHNHAVAFDEGTVLHRKGATPADLNQFGVIPGSMKTGTYITKGLGNEEYLSSASHGAGRKMSRGFAKKNIDMAHFKEQMIGIVANVSEATLDEAPDAYKDLEYVINAQRGIVVDVIDHITPLINIKG
jgi:tRNA-splicing ligase RtcB